MTRRAETSRGGTDSVGETRPRPINPLAALTLVLVFPHRTFERLRERPHWIVPLVFVAVASMLRIVYAVRGGFMDETLRGIAFRTGADPTEVASGLVAAGVVTAVVAVPVVALLETLFLKLAGALFGGRAGFRQVFSAVAHAAVPVGIGALVFALVMPLTRSVSAEANLAFLVDAGTHPYLWSLARQIDLFSIWFFVLVGIAAVPLFGLDRRRARLAALLFAVIHIVLLSWPGRGATDRLEDPYEGWSRVESAPAVVRHSSAADPDVVAECLAAAARATDRAAAVAGADSLRRIDVYLYASLDEKESYTDNREVAHGVEWAGAAHVAWVDGAELALTRETMKVIAAAELGKVYNPLIREGLAIYAGGVWGGRPVAEVASGLVRDGGIPPLERLTDPAVYSRMERSVAEPLAGAFTAFMASRMGEAGLADLYASSAGRGVSIRGLLERALGDSLGGIDRAWRAYLAPAGAGDTTSESGYTEAR